jgi:ABC-type nitrate/sulfonate/bicarbonate transport system permease component
MSVANTDLGRREPETPAEPTVAGRVPPRGSLSLLRRLNVTRRASGRRAIVSLVVGLLIWEACYRLFDMNPLLVSPPSAVGQRFGELLSNGELLRDVRVSATQFAIGYLGCAALAVPLGLLMGLLRPVRDYLGLWITALYATPSVALAPLFIIWLGFGVPSKAFIVALMAFFPIVINSTAGVDSLASENREVADAFRANRFEQFIKVLLPGSLPFIFAGLRLAVGRGLVGLVVGDLFGSTDGLGHLILNASQTFNTADIFVGAILLALSGVLLTALLTGLESRLSPWRRLSR